MIVRSPIWKVLALSVTGMWRPSLCSRTVSASRTRPAATWRENSLAKTGSGGCRAARLIPINSWRDRPSNRSAALLASRMVSVRASATRMTSLASSKSTR